jgi:signal transduction histidine kinase
MFNVVRDLLSYSRVSGDSEKSISAVSSEEIIAEAIEQCRASIDDTDASVTHDALPHVSGNRSQLIDVFQNLISNAVAYSTPGIPPRIHITASYSDGYWEFVVSDNGIGIDMQYADIIFQPFKRLHGGNLPGTGLGLAICKRVVERHGGRISVQSTPGKGAMFRFTLPGARQVSAVHSCPP